MRENLRERPPLQADDAQYDELGGKYAAELRDMRDRAFLLTERYKQQQVRANRDGEHADMFLFERRLVRRMAKLGVPMFAHCVVRTVQEQNAAYVRGVSKARGGQSPHQYGLASDIVHSVKGWSLTRKQWDVIGHVGKESAAALGIAVEWGGDWEFYDPAHWQLADWKKLRVNA